MFTWIAKKVFGTSNERAIRRIQPMVGAINALEADLKALSDAELQAKTPYFKEKLDNGATLDDILIEAFAVCREAGRRVLKMRHYDVQLIGGAVLHKGAIAEMRTGEGKTLVATLPVYLNALEGKGVHVITVNDYLAKRDAEWMGRIYKFLGMSVGTIVNGQYDEEKKASYKADICYGQNNEFGFDYLRDNMKYSALDYCQRPLNYAIVDEVDSILIDEARTPLIISGPAEAASDSYRTLNEVVARLRKDEHFSVDEKAFSAALTDDGVEHIQKAIGVRNLYDPVNVQTLHILNQLLRAHALYKRDQHYMVSPDGKVLIIDEFTGRVLAGRRWSDGLHQAVEAKENVRIQEESRTMATITFQNLFRIYKKLAGMTGTAETEAQEFSATYKLDVVVIPTNRTAVRTDDHDVVYKTEREKFNALVRDIVALHEEGKPILVGTTSVEKSGAIARILGKKGIAHHVLNAKHHENEAFVVAQAGRKGAITVSTNMAGRGTDILLGGNPEMIARNELKQQGVTTVDENDAAFKELVAKHERQCKIEHDEVIELGGLHIIGTERHESRRIDNQLRGRAGRQGDPGYSKFYLSLEDDLMRIFAGDRVKSLMDRMGMPDDEPIEHPLVTRSIENAQRKVEERNFDVRKNLLEYDDVMNAQRKTVYALRQQLLAGRYAPEDIDETGKATGEARQVPVDPEILEKVEGPIGALVGMFCDPPIGTVKEDGKPKYPTRASLEKAEKLVELEALQHEVYQLWGTRLDVEERRQRTPASVYDELVGSVPLGLSEQRERVLDLVDRVVAAMVEESCVEGKPPEDWDWKGLHDGFQEHFKQKLDDSVDELGEADTVMKRTYECAEEIYRAKEQELGVEIALRLFRHIYVEGIDEAWVDHLSNMEHLRDGIGLRGYGQRDPKNEYKKEGYDLFLNMMAKVSSNVLVKFFEAQVQRTEEMAAREQETERRYQEELAQVVAQHPSAETEDPAAALNQLREQAAAVPQPQRRPVTAAPRIGRNDPCPCGSGKKFKKCHGAILEEEGADADDVDEVQPQP
ncbi:MAG TPA: preprotein translocase subunit SecA [Polyangiaceae bacterium]|nr:preprotein translocase subunit SecA [Polyangiaceae bacterium]